MLLFEESLKWFIAFCPKGGMGSLPLPPSTNITLPHPPNKNWKPYKGNNSLDCFETFIPSNYSFAKCDVFVYIPIFFGARGLVPVEHLGGGRSNCSPAHLQQLVESKRKMSSTLLCRFLETSLVHLSGVCIIPIITCQSEFTFTLHISLYITYFFVKDTPWFHLNFPQCKEDHFSLWYKWLAPWTSAIFHWQCLLGP